MVINPKNFLLRGVFVTFFLSLYCGSLFAQSLSADEPVFQSPETAENKASLEKAMANLAIWPVVSGDFVKENFVKRLNRTFLSQGDFLFAGDDGIIWDVKSPGKPFKIVMDDRGMVTLDSLGKVRKAGTKEIPAMKRLTGAMLSLFGGDIENLKKDFTFYYKKESDGSSTVGLIPKNGTWRKSIKGLVLNGRDTLHSFSLYTGNGDISSYTFTVKQRGKIISNEQKAKFSY